MPPVGFEPTIPAGVQPQTYTLDRAATETGITSPYLYIYIYIYIERERERERERKRERESHFVLDCKM